MKNTMIYMFATLILSTSAALAMGGAALENGSNNQATTAGAYIDDRLADALEKSISPMNTEKLYGKWKLVLTGPISIGIDKNRKIGQYNASGIIGADGVVPTMSISATQTDWLPSQVNKQNIVIFSEPLLTLKYGYHFVKANEPVAIKIVGDHFVIRVEDARKVSELKCGFSNNNFDHLICVESDVDPGWHEIKIIKGYERVKEGK